MNKPRLVNVWTLTLNVNVASTYGDLKELSEEVEDVMNRLMQTEIVPPAFIWQRRGAVLTVHTQGNPQELIEIGQWALDNMASPGPTGFELSRSLTVPLQLTEGWKGYDGN